MLYLQKASNELISHCKCETAYISSPGQMDCPWCGCGWLFTCSTCRKAFTFAEAVDVDFTLEDIVRRDFEERGTAKATDEEVKAAVEFMTIFLDCLELGQRYVYLDGYVIPVDADEVSFEGFHSSHHLRVVPQVEGLRDPVILRDLLGNPKYWRDSGCS